MAGEIASAFVRVRPNMTGFKPEVESGVKSAFGNLRKIVGGALAAAGAFEVGKSIVEAAAGHQAQFAILDQTLKNAGDATFGFGTSLDGVLEKEARLKGFSDEQLAQAMVRLVSVTHDSRAAFHDLGEAEDLSRARGIDLATAALAISKAIQGRTASLQRYGIVLPKITTAEDDLKKKLAEAVQGGAKVTGSLKEQYDAALKVAKATDQAAMNTEALTLINQRFGGSARTFADTASGQFDRLQVDVHQLEVALGGPLLGGLAGLAEGAGSLTTSLAENHGAVEAERSVVTALGQAWDSTKAVIQTVAPVLTEVADAGAKVLGAVGATPILAAVVAIKGYTVATAAAGSARALWTRAVIAGTGAAVAEADAVGKDGAARALDAEATDADTAAKGANTGATETNTVALADATAQLELFDAAIAASAGMINTATGELALFDASLVRTGATAGATADELYALSASEVAAGAAGGEAAAGGLASVGAGLSGIGGILLSAAGGPLVVGLAAVAGALAYIATRGSAAGTALGELKSGLGSAAQALTTVPADQLSVKQAELNKRVADHAVATSTAAHGSTEYQQALLNASAAADQLDAAVLRLENDTASAAGGTAKARKGIQDFVAAAEASARTAQRGGAPSRLDVVHPEDAAARATLVRQAAVVKLSAALQDQSAKEAAQSPLLSRNLRLLAEFVTQTGKLPTKKTTEFFIDNTNAKASLRDLASGEQTFIDQQTAVGRAAGEKLVEAFGATASQALEGLGLGFGGGGGPSSTAAAITNAIGDALDQAKQDLKAGKAAKKAYDAGAAAIKAIGQGVKTDQESLDLLKQQMADQVIAAAEATASAISGAKQSFAQIGSTIADDLAAVLDQPLVDAGYTLQLQGDRLAATFDAQSIKLQAKAAALAAETTALQVAQEARTARFAGESQRLANAENAAQLAQQARTARFAGESQRLSNAQAETGLAADRRTLANLRGEVAFPGGKILSSNTRTALAQLTAYANHAKGISKDAVQDFINQFRAAAQRVEADKIGIAEQLSPKKAQREANRGVATSRIQVREEESPQVAQHLADLGLATARNAESQQALARRKAVSDARIQIKRDADQIAQDLNDAKVRAARREIGDLIAAFNAAPSRAGLAHVNERIAAILQRDHVSIKRAGSVLGSYFAQGFQGALTGLDLQGKALIGAPAQGGGGQIPSITRPLETIRQQGEQAAQLTKQYRTTSLDLQKKQHALTAKIAGSLAAAKLASSLVRNPGEAGTRARRNRGTTP